MIFTIAGAVVMYVVLLFVCKMRDAVYDVDGQKDTDVFGDPVPRRDRSVILGLPAYLWPFILAIVVGSHVPSDAVDIVLIAAVCISGVVYFIVRDVNNKKALDEMFDDEMPDGEEGTNAVAHRLASAEELAPDDFECTVSHKEAFDFEVMDGKEGTAAVAPEPASVKKPAPDDSCGPVPHDPIVLGLPVWQCHLLVLVIAVVTYIVTAGVVLGVTHRFGLSNLVACVACVAFGSVCAWRLSIRYRYDDDGITMESGVYILFFRIAGKTILMPWNQIYVDHYRWKVATDSFVLTSIAPRRVIVLRIEPLTGRKPRECLEFFVAEKVPVKNFTEEAKIQLCVVRDDAEVSRTAAEPKDDGVFFEEAVFEGKEGDDVFEEEAVFDTDPKIIKVPRI